MTAFSQLTLCGFSLESSGIWLEGEAKQRKDKTSINVDHQRCSLKEKQQCYIYLIKIVSKLSEMPSVLINTIADRLKHQLELLNNININFKLNMLRLVFIERNRRWKDQNYSYKVCAIFDFPDTRFLIIHKFYRIFVTSIFIFRWTTANRL